MTKYGSRSRPVTLSYTRDHINLVSEPIMGDTDPIASKLNDFMEKLTSHQQVFIEQITSRQQGLEEQIAEISRTVQDAKRRPLPTADNPTSAEYGPSRGSGVRPELPTSSTMAPRYSKMEFLTYSGEGDPLSWVKRCEKFFTNQRTTETDKVGLPAFHLVGEAQLRFDQVEQEELEMTWKQFRDHCHIRFGPPLSNNPLGELANLKQTSSVEDYQRQFQSLLARTSDLRPQQHVDLFTAGLVEDLCINIELQKPRNLGIAMNMATALERKQCFH
ncbi:hypothetical protein ZIOFF_051699 [Zingiber officinale]|uniref:Ty3 transposon capsid-like protein domain-containing protein n=1 Tax=Zingiber officinale TaxID=94328 RepID=A0A8J5FN40_ZINOF|nr:hypothetical protein ZIOFF_051699 [Zingiber officinale]